MRTAVGVTNGRCVLNLYGHADRVAMRISDRKADGEAFPSEILVRLPRRLGVDRCHCVSGRYLAPRCHPDGTRNYNVV
jgi:hypothetical protein